MTRERLHTPLRFLPAVALFVAAGVFATSNAQRATAQDGAGAEAAQDHQDEEHGELHESMEIIQRNMKALRKVMTKPAEKEKAIELCRAMEAAALTGFVNMPTAPEELDGEKRLAFEVDFRKRMLDVASQLLDLEVAIQKEDSDSVKKLYRALGEAKKTGHDIYIK